MTDPLRRPARLRCETARSRAWLLVAIVTVAIVGCVLPQPRPLVVPVVPPVPTPERHVFRLVWPTDVSGNMAIVGARSEGRIAASLERGIGIAFHFVAIEPGVQALGIVLANHTRDTVVVPWHLARLMGPDMVSHRISNRDDRLVERPGANLPTRVPPGSVLEDYVFPTQFISDLAPGARQHSPYFEQIRDGQTVMLVLPMRIGGRITSHTFRFRASVESPS